MNIVRITKVTDEFYLALKKLVPQLGPFAQVPTISELIQVVESPMTFVYVACNLENNNKIVGTLTLITYRTPTALHARIEDVIVDEDVRCKGIGEALSKVAIQQAKDAGVDFIDLTSRPSREAANHLYQKLGFEKRETNTYRYEIVSDK